MRQNLKNELTFEKKQWSIKRNSRKHCVLFHDLIKNTQYTYLLEKNDVKITGVYQCSLTDFFVFFIESSTGKSGFDRVTFPGDGCKKIYSFSSAEGFVFLDDNFILLLSISDPYLFGVNFRIYDISKNKKLKIMDFDFRKYFPNDKMVDFLNFIIHADVSVKSSKKDYYLYCERKISLPSTFYNCADADYLQVLFDAETFDPALPIFSTLRGSLIDFSNYCSLDELLSEEIYYKHIVTQNLEKINSSIYNTGKSILLRAFDE